MSFAKKGHHKLSVPQLQSVYGVTMFKEIQNKHMFMVPGQFSSHLYWWQCFHFLCWREIIVSLSHPFSGFRFCAINHVSTPKLLPLISVTCPMNTRKVHTVTYNELCNHLWYSLAPTVHKLLCNPVGSGHFCALPSQCLALWQCQQLNMSVCHSSSVVDMLGALSTCPATVESLALYLTVIMLLHILQTASPTGSRF